ncbi:MAG TPA: EAL domain-containing protein [Mycobacteriales bacterium]|nr:EAL domain-containing protein [Mycobacteriales bacterium]
MHRTVFVFDHDLRYLYVGGAHLAGLGRARTDFVGRTLGEMFDVAGATAREPAYRQALAGETVTFDAPLNGDRTLETHLCPLLDRDDRVVAALGFTVDVTDLRAGATDLRDAQEQFRLTFQNAPIGKALADVQGTVLRVNPALCRILDRQDVGLVGTTLSELTHPDDQPAQHEQLEQLLSGVRDTVDLELRYRGAGSSYVWVLLTYTVVRHLDGTASHFIAQVVDITEKRAQQATIEAGHAFQEAVLAASPDIISVFDIAGDSVIWASTSVSTVLGHTAQELVELGPDLVGRLVHPDDAACFQASNRLAAALPDGSTEQLRHRMLHVDGGYRWLSRRVTPFAREAGTVTQLLAVSRDISDMVAAQALLEHSASHDVLTDLPNRALVEARIHSQLEGMQGGQEIAVLFCDLDGFKRINDAYGHHTGDQVLVQTARRLLGCVRSGDTVGRIGGDEFVVVVSCRQDEDPAKVGDDVARRIGLALSLPIELAGVEHVVSTSIGVALGVPGSTAEDLLREADSAMYEAKSRGRNNAVRYIPELRENALGRDRVERQVRQAMAADAVEVFYQPIVRPGTGQVYGVEALLRIPDGEGGHLDTGEAVLLAEQAGLIVGLGERLLGQACQQVARWRRQPGHEDLHLSVNLSAHEVARSQVYERICRALATSGLPPEALTVEITETVLLDAGPGMVVDLERLRAEGVGIAIDDFGTGYASLRYLASLPVTCLKIDRSFTAGLPHDRTSVTLVRATLRLAEDLGLSCVAEGIESVEQQRCLPVDDRVLVQGYLYGRPQPATVPLPAWLPVPGSGHPGVA